MPRAACHMTSGWVASTATVTTMGLSGAIHAPGWEVGVAGATLGLLGAGLGDLPDRAEGWVRHLGLTVRHRGWTHAFDTHMALAGLLGLLVALWRPELGWVTCWASLAALWSHSVLDRLNTTPVQAISFLPWAFKFLPGRWFPEASEREHALECVLPVLIAVGWIVVAWPMARGIVFGWAWSALPAPLHVLAAHLGAA